MEPVLCPLCREFASLPQEVVITGHHAMLDLALPQGALPQVVDAAAVTPQVNGATGSARKCIRLRFSSCRLALHVGEVCL